MDLLKSRDKSGNDLFNDVVFVDGKILGAFRDGKSVEDCNNSITSSKTGSLGVKVSFNCTVNKVDSNPDKAAPTC